MQAFSKLVALKGVDTEINPKAALVNDLAGMSGELLDNVRAADSDTALATWDGIKRRAWDKLLLAVEDALLTQYSFSRVLYASDSFMPYGSAGAVSPTEEGRVEGVYLSIPDPRRTESRLLALQFLADPAEDWIGSRIQVLIFDAADHSYVALLDEAGDPMPPAEHFVDTGFNEILIDGLIPERYRERVLFVGFQSYGLNLVECSIPVAVGPVIVEGATVDLATRSLTRTGESSFVHPLIEIDCSIEKLINREARRFRSAWQLLLGAELLDEKINSNRTNFFSSSNLSITVENRDGLRAQFSKAVKNAVKLIDAGKICPTCTDAAIAAEEFVRQTFLSA